MEEMVIHVELASESKSASVYFMALSIVFFSRDNTCRVNHIYCNLPKVQYVNVKEGVHHSTCNGSRKNENGFINWAMTICLDAFLNPLAHVKDRSLLLLVTTAVRHMGSNLSDCTAYISRCN
jgi:hypothetical protein